MAGAAAPVIAPNRWVYLVVFVIGVVVLGALFVRYGLLTLPSGSAQQIAAYYGARLIPLGIALILIGFVAAIATAVGTLFGKAPPAGGAAAAAGPAGLDVGQLTELFKAAAGLSSTPAGIGVLVTVLGAALLIGSGFASAATPPATT